MVLIPAGPFQMGCDPDSDSICLQDEMPLHTVILDAFYIDKYEVTNALYQACVEADACERPSDTSSATHKSYYGNSEFAGYPVIYVSWSESQTYCNWRGARLPTEAEWEKAARGDQKYRIYPWGNQEPDCTLANYCEEDTVKVGSYPDGASPYQVMDMAGNVWEYVADWHGEFYYEESPSSNPLGPVSGSNRVLRGGSFWSHDLGLRTAFRWEFGDNYHYVFFGFRCAATSEK